MHSPFISSGDDIKNLLNVQMQNERVKTEEHIEYDSGDDPDDEGSSSSEKSSHHKYKPETYKTRKDERMTEYYRTKVDNNNKVTLYNIFIYVM